MQRFRNILVVVEDESRHEAAVACALRLARETGARLTFLDVAGGPPGAIERLLAALPDGVGARIEAQSRAEMVARVEALASGAREAGVEAAAAVDEGTAYVAIIRRVLRDGHDLVLKGQHTGASRLAGSYRGPDLHLMRKCPCPVWIVQDDTAAAVRRILACIDPDTGEGDEARRELNRLVLDLSRALATRDRASVDVLAVWRVEGEGLLRSGRYELVPGEVDRIVERERLQSLARLEAALAEVPADGLVRNVLHLKGVPGDVIPEHARQAGIDTIVMGTVGRTGIAGVVIGNTAETILGRVGCSVVAVKPPGFVSPVTL
ncbi:MAG: universal stress protein [Rhodobacteraceae bacterium]|jgi:nucleotide-binding universal stress UspA family protein|nr:universal stress protein [Paracoccaceae bacterium]